MKQYKMRKGEQGNVLFLILIAVALFAALSYAVTSSSRSGGGDVNDETSLVSSSSVTQYPASVRTALLRMMVSNQIEAEDIQFDKPTDFDTDCTANPDECAFHPKGGGATYAPASADVMADGNPGDWYFNANFEIEDVGTNGAGGNDIIALLPGIKKSICEKINEKLGIDSAADITDDLTDASLTYDFVDGETFPTTDQENIGDSTNMAGLTGQPYGCFIDSTSTTYVYYHVLIER